jgi:hypothetical protein
MLILNSFLQIKSDALIKLALVVLLLMCIPAQVYSQNQNITITSKQAKISTLFEDIESQTGMTIAYNSAIIDINKVVSVNISNKTLSEALTEILKNTGTTFTIQGKQIIISKADDQAKRRISGTITDITGEPIIGATVKIKGTNTATITDMDGKYTIEASPKEHSHLLVTP